jgi:hypothetical protein
VSAAENAAFVEYATTARLAAYKSLAKAAGVGLDVVLRHAANDTLKALVAGPVAERRAKDAHVARIQRLYDLRIRDAALRALASD